MTINNYVGELYFVRPHRYNEMFTRLFLEWVFSNLKMGKILSVRCFWVCWLVIHSQNAIKLPKLMVPHYFSGRFRYNNIRLKSAGGNGKLSNFLLCRQCTLSSTKRLFIIDYP